MLRLTKTLERSNLILCPVEFLGNLRVCDFDNIDDLFLMFDMKIVTDYLPDDLIKNLTIRTSIGTTTAEHLSEGVAIYILSLWSIKNNKKVQFLAGSVGRNVGDKLAELVIFNDNVSLLMQGTELPVSFDNCKSVRLDGVSLEGII